MARVNVPNATFIHHDMLTLDFAEDSFDGVAAFYTLTHLPYGELPRFLRKMGGWVRAGGLLVATLSSGPNWGQVEPDWLGAPMYFSGYSMDDNKRFVEEAGFQVRTATVETIHEDGRPVAFLWVVAQKRTGACADLATTTSAGLRARDTDSELVILTEQDHRASAIGRLPEET